MWQLKKSQLHGQVRKSKAESRIDDHSKVEILDGYDAGCGRGLQVGGIWQRRKAAWLETSRLRPEENDKNRSSLALLQPQAPQFGQNKPRRSDGLMGTKKRFEANMRVDI